MIFDDIKQKGVLDRSFQSRSVAFHHEMNYEHMLQKSVRSVWPDAPSSSTFYLANGSGISIGGVFDLELPNGT